jgi:hypothetical protein
VVAVEEITWEVLDAARPVLDQVRARMTEDEYLDDRSALRKFLCAYFNSGDKDCKHKQGRAISPLGFATGAGGKCLKARWGIPGGGKSGGLRLAVVAYCKEKRVRLAGAWVRKSDPDDEDFAKVFEVG